MYCSGCGNKLNDDDRFCSNCGKAVQIESNANQTIQNKAIDVKTFEKSEFEKKSGSKKMIIAVIIILIVFGLGYSLHGRGNKANNASVESLPKSEDMENNQPYTESKVNEENVQSAHLKNNNSSEKNIRQQKANTDKFYQIEEEDYIINVPTYWKEDESSETFRAYAETSGKVAVLMIQDIEDDELSNPLEPKVRNVCINGLFEGMKDSGASNIIITKEETYHTDKYDGYLWNYSYEQGGIPAEAKMFMIPMRSKSGVVAIHMMVSNNTKYKYDDEFLRMISNLDIKNNSKTSNKDSFDSYSKEQVLDNKDNNDKGVNKDLKAFLDSYEDYIDEYVAFMKKYKNNPSDLSLLNQYSKMLDRYNEFAKKIDSYDSSNLSKEEYNYYLDVTTRCTKKMLEAY